MNTSQIWEKVSDFLKNQMTQESYDLWIKPLSPVSISDNKFTIQAPNKFFSDCIVQHHKKNIEKLLSELNDNKKIAIEFQYLQDLDSILKKSEETLPLEETLDAPTMLETSFNTKFSFDNFVERL